MSLSPFGFIEQCVSKANEQTNKLIEQMAIAFVSKYGVHPAECTLCQQVGADGVIRWWFEDKRHSVKMEPGTTVGPSEWAKIKLPDDDDVPIVVTSEGS